MSSRSPQLGYNHNIPHRGRLYHVQTEDSGIKKAHIFTHVFYDGTIIASNKVMYETDDADDVEVFDQRIVGLMQESHKDMIRQLRRAAFDEKIITYIGPHPDAEEGKEAPEAAPEAAPTPEAPTRRPPPEPRDVEPQGPPLDEGAQGPTVDPTLTHPVYSSPAAQAQVAASANEPPKKRRGPSRARRRAVGGIGGAGVSVEDAGAVAARRDIIVGKFAAEHQVALDEEILALLREEG